MNKKIGSVDATEQKSLTCGLVMPISAIDGLLAEHWLEVKAIFTEAVNSLTEPRFIPKLVSEEEDVGVILKRIVQNVYSSDIIVCDVSGKNANVMFELGMRLAFDRPTIIVKDDKTDYSFDTSVIEHLIYPRDLRFSRIVTFKEQLADKVQATYKKSLGSDHSTFLKNFGTFTVAALSEKKSSVEEVILERLNDVQRELAVLRKNDSIATRKFKTESVRWEDTDLRQIQFGLKVLIPSLIEEYKQSQPNKLMPIDKKALTLYIIDQMGKQNFLISDKLISVVEETIDAQIP